MNEVSRRDGRSAIWPMFGVIDRLFDSPSFVLAEQASNDNGNLAIDVSEQDAHFVIRASLPGFSKESVTVNIEEGVVTIKAQHAEEKEEKSERFYRRERRSGSLARRVALPGMVDESGATAELRDGVLTLRVPKANHSRTRTVEVQ